MLDIKFPSTTIPTTETNYMCMLFDMPLDADYHLFGWEAILDNVNVIHHMLVYACDDVIGKFSSYYTHNRI